ncbi:2-C-methyl-D-erythritol 4-phosphate cytidylyltransferase [Candidatus Bipolaricaulota bacterium]|nr:2-C-methyl-D-erythritol 4-phosphate cytidylyltransferase [Candidatus Bipolaricaulota bacterium]
MSLEASGVILAAGRGERFGGGKAFATLRGRPLLVWCADAFVVSGAVGELVVVARPGEEELVAEVLAGVPLPLRLVSGGERRQDSARAGVEAAGGKYVLIHDAARPLVTPNLIRRVLEAAKEHGAAVPALPVVDTVRYLDERGFLRPQAVPRRGLVRIQTPQGFRRDHLLSALEEPERKGLSLTDDAAALLAVGAPVATVPGDPKNLKITHPNDLPLAEALFSKPPL